jgi:hypothetical protein
VSVLCRLFGVARSTTYYQPRGRHLEPQCDPVCVEAIRAVIEAPCTYGVRMTHARLTKGQGMIVNRKKVHGIMLAPLDAQAAAHRTSTTCAASQVHRRVSQPALGHRHRHRGLRARWLVRLCAGHRLLIA